MSNEITDDPLFNDIDLHLWALIQQVRNIILRARDKELALYDISEVQVAVIFVISAIGHDATPGEIARWMLRQPHAISAVLDRMEENGLVRRVKDLKSKSMVRIEVTPKSRDILHKANSLKTIHRIISALSGEERLQLRSLLFKLRKAACQDVLAKVPLFPPMNTNSY